MAGMFYSLKETAEKLKKTEEEVKRLAREGKLREFRDGSNIMFKIDEVETLITEEMPIPFDEGPKEDIVTEYETASLSDLGTSEDKELEPVTDNLEPLEELSDITDESLLLESEPMEMESLEQPQEISDESPSLEPEPADSIESLPELESLEELPELSGESALLEPESATDSQMEPADNMESLAESESLEELPDISDESLLLEQEPELDESQPLEEALETSDAALPQEMDQLLDLEGTGTQESAEIPAPESELDIDSEPEAVAPDSALVDTASASQDEQVTLSDTQVLSSEQMAAADEDDDIALISESDSLTEDKEPADIDTALIDTALTGEGVSVLGETDDYKLTDDTMAETLAAFGGTGEASLEEIEEDVNLDSFGSGSGLLDLSLQADDTSLGGILDEIYTTEGEEGAAPAEVGTAEDVVAEAEQLPIEAETESESFGVAATPAPSIKTAYAEAAPDTQSNILGAMLFLPLAILIFTMIIVWAAVMGVTPVILTSTQGFIWIIVAVACVACLGIAGFALTKGGDKEAKPKKVKIKKAKKEPKPKKEKKKKERKPKKEKKKK